MVEKFKDEKMKAILLKTFLKGTTEPKAGMPGCANYDHHYSGCLFGDCLIEQGKRCVYFEKAVLPTGNSVIRQKYEDMMGIYIKGPAANLCSDCGSPIAPKMKCCDKCKKKRQRATYRQRKAG